MMLFAAIVLGFGVLSAAVASPRFRRLFVIKEELKALPPMTPEDTQKLEEWKAIFRTIVIETDGMLSPTMEQYLSSHDALVLKVLAEARAQAEKEKMRIIEEARQAREEILKEEENWSKSKRPLLCGSALKEYENDFAACKEPHERGAVIRRWHNKGFRFSMKMRAELLEGATDMETRTGWRALFDEQDKDTVT